MNFEPIIPPVNWDFLFDRVNFIVEPLRVSAHVLVYCADFVYKAMG